MQLVYSILFAIVLAPATAFLRWQLGKAHWAAYPGGSKGHLLDCVNASVPIAPVAAGALCYSLLPPGETRNYIAWGLVAAGMVYGFLPPARRSNLRLIQARFDGKPQ